jgi:hypothetical protein
MNASWLAGWLVPFPEQVYRARTALIRTHIRQDPKQQKGVLGQAARRISH